MTGRAVRANSLDFGILEAGTGPLALCLHGFPDTAHTWRQLLPELAAAGFHAVAPFMRGYAPTDIPPGGSYGIASLGSDANALHEMLGGDEQAVLIGHDWGAETAYAAAAAAPDRWRRLVTLAVPPAALDPVLFSDYEQLKRFFYIFLLRDPAAAAEQIVAADGMRFIERLWRDWSPGFDATVYVDYVRESLGDRANLAAAIGYYRAWPAAGPADGDGLNGSSAAPPQPVLYLHGTADGCIGAGLVGDAERHLSQGSKLRLVENAGHFLHLEQPRAVNRHILDWVTAGQDRLGDDPPGASR